MKTAIRCVSYIKQLAAPLAIACLTTSILPIGASGQDTAFDKAYDP